MHADYLTVAARTSGKKLSMFVVDAKAKGITRRPMQTTGSEVTA